MLPGIHVSISYLVSRGDFVVFVDVKYCSGMSFVSLCMSNY